MVMRYMQMHDHEFDFYLIIIVIVIACIGILLGMVNIFMWCHTETHSNKNNPENAYTQLNYPNRKERVKRNINNS